MSEHLGYIDSYFNKELSVEERRIFDLRIEQDPAFAEEVAFYLTTLNTAKAELATQKKERFREIYQEIRPTQQLGIIRRFWPYVSAAAVVAIVVLGIYLFKSPSTPQDFADTYILENFQKLGTTMDSGIDSIKVGKQFFDDGKLDSALIYFESILQRDSTLYYVNKFAGITSLRLEKHDEAIKYFTRMEKENGLYQNPGMFYHAVALIHRNHPGDQEKARELLEVVVKDNLGEKEIAEKWIK